MISGPPAPPPRDLRLGRILDAAAASPHGVTFVDSWEGEARLGWDEVRSRAGRLAAALAEAGIEPGERVAVAIRTSPDLLVALFGAVLAGAVPTPLYPPTRLGRMDEWVAATARMLERSAARVVVTEPGLRLLLGRVVERARPSLGCRTVPDLLAATPGSLFREGDPDDLALLQFSSGTTAAPKPVALTHRQVATHLAAILSAIQSTPTDTCVSWLPLYHDMGLIGCLLGAAASPAPLVLIPPEAFLSRPSLWLRAIHRHRGTVSAAPSFAFGLCARRIRDEDVVGLDLSCWRVALDGAEPVAAGAARSFTARFRGAGFDPRALMPVYGLAEATLAVAFPPPGRGPRFLGVDLSRLAREGEVVPGDHEVASVGHPLPGCAVEVRDTAGREVPEGRLGRIHVRGPSVVADPAGDPGMTPAGWLDTGDLGFVKGGELHVCGRARDVVVVRGANHPAELFERCLDGLPGLRPGAAVAVGLVPAGGDGEELLILAERARGGGPEGDRVLEARIREGIGAATGIRPHGVVLLEPGALPRTSSGKPRRSEALRRHLAGALAPPPREGPGRLATEALRSVVAYARARANPAGGGRLGSGGAPSTDVVVVGGGPAGLAAAVAAAGIGLSVVVLERRRGTPDKACGEGLLPPAVRALGALGVLSRVDPDARAPVAALRYVQEDGTFAEARLPGAALGVRRPALVEALASRAAEAGVEVRAGCTARGFRRIPAGISVETDAGDVRGRILVAADGLASPLRRAAGLDRPVRGSRRFGMRRHFRVEPWGPRVEVHFAAGIEAYVTPVGPRRVGVAFLWEDGAVAPATFDGFLARFPALSERLAGAAPDSPILGAGPLARGVRAPVADGVALVGDAAGYLDALTGEGLCLAFDDALCLSRVLPGALSRGATAAALAPYARDRRARFRRYASVTSAVLAVARRPPLRRAAIRWLSAHPRTFEAMVAWALGGDLTPSPLGVPASDP